MTQPAFIFFLQDKQNRFWNVNSAGEVVVNANPYPLQFSPDGWQDIAVKNVRNRKYWGIDRGVSTDFKYVEDGAKILKHIFYTLGPDALVFLTICELNLHYEAGVGYGYWYKQIFRSAVDLHTFDHAGAYVTATTVEEGLPKYLRANENTVYEFPLDVDEAVTVKMDGVILRNKVEAITDPGDSTDGAFYFGNHIVGLTVTSNEVANLGAGRSVERTQVGNHNDDIRATGEYFLKATVATTVTLTYKFRLTVEYTPSSPAINPAAVFKVVVRRIDESNVSDLQVELLSRTAGAGVPGVYDVEGTTTIDVRELDELYLYAFCNVEGASGDSQIRSTYQVEDDTLFKAEYDYRFQTTYIKALRPQYLFSALVDKITDGAYAAVDCPYFDQLQYWDRVFTPGDGIRALTDAKLKISLSQFFDFWNTQDEVGLSDTGTSEVLLDRKAALSDDTTTVSLGTISRLNPKMAAGWSFNELAIGYPDIKNELGVLNGKNAVNTAFNFTTGATNAPRKLTKISPVKVDCYDIENIRITTFQQTSTDNKADGDPYALHIADTLVAASGSIPAHYELDRTYNASVTGVEQASSVFNLELSPKNCLLRSGDFLRSCFYIVTGKKLKFTSADRNAGMTYVNGSDVVVENADEPIGDLDAPFFQPVTLMIETDAPVTDDALVWVDFDFEGVNYLGLAMSTGANLGSRKKQTFELLSHPDNDLTKLIKYFG